MQLRKQEFDLKQQKIDTQNAWKKEGEANKRLKDLEYCKKQRQRLEAIENQLTALQNDNTNQLLYIIIRKKERLNKDIKELDTIMEACRHMSQEFINLHNTRSNNA